MSTNPTNMAIEMEVMNINLEAELFMDTGMMEMPVLIYEEDASGGLDEITSQQAMESRLEFYTFLYGMQGDAALEMFSLSAWGRIFFQQLSPLPMIAVTVSMMKQDDVEVQQDNLRKIRHIYTSSCYLYKQNQPVMVSWVWHASDLGGNGG